MSVIADLHDAVKSGDVAALEAMLQEDRGLANSRSETDPRGTFPLHVAAESGHSLAAHVLLRFGADVALRDSENDAIPLCWAAFFGRPEVVRVLLAAGSELNRRNVHGLTPLACAVEGSAGRWKTFSNASLAEWQECADAIAACGGCECAGTGPLRAR